MPASPRLSTTIDPYLASRRSRGKAASTLKADRINLRKLLASTGDIAVARIDAAHIDRLFERESLTRSDGSLNNLHAALSTYFAWCRVRGYAPREWDPLEGRTLRKVPKRDRRRLHVSRFPALLDAANHPQRRILYALGLYLFLRAGEIADLRWRDVDLPAGDIKVRIAKTRDVDTMPICAELDAEIRRWATWWTNNLGPIDPDAYLVPAKQGGYGASNRGPDGRLVYDPLADRIDPYRPISHVERIVQDGLEAVGIPRRNPDGTPAMEGCHVLRRSGARALYDHLVQAGYDGALRRVQAMLHHSTTTMTEHYLGIDLDRQSRDAALRGRPMFPALDAPTSLHAVRDTG